MTTNVLLLLFDSKVKRPRYSKSQFDQGGLCHHHYHHQKESENMITMIENSRVNILYYFLNRQKEKENFSFGLASHGGIFCVCVTFVCCVLYLASFFLLADSYLTRPSSSLLLSDYRPPLSILFFFFYRGQKLGGFFSRLTAAAFGGFILKSSFSFPHQLS